MRNKYSQQHTEAFIEYHERYQDDIFRFCMVKTGNRNQALDITQESFMKFWEYLSDGNDIDNPRALLYRIARNLIIDNYRKKQDVLVEHYHDDALQEELTYDPVQQLEDHIDGEYVLKVLNKLPELTREIITLRFLNQMSVSEIASIVDQKPKTVSVYLHRGLKKLSSIITNYEKK